MKWVEGTPRASFRTVLLGSALGAAIAAALGQFINWAQAFIR